jgi:hypothetical protein
MNPFSEETNMPKRYKFVCNIGFGDVFKQTILWLILIIFTLGLAIPFFAYFFIKLIINSTEIIEIANY